MKPTTAFCGVKNANQELVRFYRSQTKKETYEDSDISHIKQCSYCFQDINAENSRVRLKRRMRLTPSLQKLFKQAEKGWHKLSKKKQHLLKSYTNSKNYLMVTCFTCNKTTKIAGFTRTDVLCKRKKYRTKNIQNLEASKVPESKPSICEQITKTYVSIPSNKTQHTSIMKSLSKKKKQKVLHKSLHHILSKEKQRNKSSGSLADFLSNMKS